MSINKYLDELKLSLLESYGVDNWSWYYESLNDFCENNELERDELDAELTLDALEAGGVDNWSGYGDALNGFSEYSDYVREMASAGKEYVDFDDYLAILADEEAQEEKKRLEEIEAAEAAEAERLKAEEEKRFQDIESLEFPDLYRKLQRIYPDAETKPIYKQIIENTEVFSRATFPEVFEAAQDAVGRSVSKVGEYIKAVRLEYMKRLIDKPEFEMFIYSNSGVITDAFILSIDLKTFKTSIDEGAFTKGRQRGQCFLSEDGYARAEYPTLQSAQRDERRQVPLMKKIMSKTSAKVTEETVDFLFTKEQISNTFYSESTKQNILNNLTLIRANANLGSKIAPTFVFIIPLKPISSNLEIREQIKRYAELFGIDASLADDNIVCGI